MRYFVRSARPIAEDLAGTLAFYLLFVVTGSVIVSACVGLLIGVVQAAVHRARGEPIPGLLAIGIALTLVLGGLSLLTHSVRFLLLKPSIVYGCIGVTMLPRGWVRRYVPGVALDLLPASTWDRVGRSWAWLMFATAVGNVVLVACLPPRQAASILLVAAAAAKVALFLGQYGVLSTRARAAHAVRAAQPPSPGAAG